jgi:nicotinamidase-related amidase
MKKALLIIDMQIMPFIWKNYGGKALFQEEALIANTKLLIEKARQAQTPIVYVLYTESGDSPRAEGQPLWQVIPEFPPPRKRRSHRQIQRRFVLKNRSRRSSLTTTPSWRSLRKSNRLPILKWFNQAPIHLGRAHLA